MRRRELMLLLGGAMTAARALRAQQKAVPVIDYLGNISLSGAAPYLAAFQQGLSETGYVEGQNLVIEYRWAEGSYDRLPTLAADLVARKVDVIVASATPGIAAAKGATSTIPIIFLGGGDLVAGLVASLARPGGNLTGISIFGNELNPKRLDLLSELVPQAGVIALLVNPSNSNAGRTVEDVQGVARAKGVQLHILKAGTESEIDTAFVILVQLHAGALVVGSDPFFNSRREQQVALAARHAVAAIYEWREFAEAGGLIACGPSLTGTWRQVGVLCRPDSRGRQAGRSADPATDEIRAGHQSEDGQGARPHRAARDPRPRRRANRIRLQGCLRPQPSPILRAAMKADCGRRSGRVSSYGRNSEILGVDASGWSHACSAA